MRIPPTALVRFAEFFTQALEGWNHAHPKSLHRVIATKHFRRIIGVPAINIFEYDERYSGDEFSRR